MSQLKEKYLKKVVPTLKKSYGYKNVMEVPRLEKVVLNIGMGEAITNDKALDAARRDLEAITGQHAVTTRSRKSIAAFKLRVGMPIGLKVTLRGERMYDFVDKLFNSVLCRIRDFQGISRNSFDGRGNYTLAFREQTMFSEIDYENIDRPRGLEISFVTTAKTDDEGRELLALMGMPFTKE
ncbi:MAG: 50S ribosomal protein L5 [Dehalococcoidales bacterium]|nr:50S ribosomal protein L5 [Dehalococcoidales bacterium]